MNLLMTKKERRRYMVEQIAFKAFFFCVWGAAIGAIAFALDKIAPGVREPIGLAVGAFVIIMLMGRRK